MINWQTLYDSRKFYVNYNTNTMEIVGIHRGYMTAAAEASKLNNVNTFNITHPINAELLEKVGIHRNQN